MSAEDAVYLDSSALVKLVVAEPESEALVAFLRRHPVRVSCAIARVEVVRAVRAHGQAAMQRARDLLARTHLLLLDDRLLEDAADLDAGVLRSLDAIHLAAAATLAGALQAMVVYDWRLRAAATGLGLAVAAPGEGARS